MQAPPNRLLSRGRDASLLVSHDGRIRVEASQGREAQIERCAAAHRDVEAPLARTIASGPGWAEFEPHFGVSFPAMSSTIKEGGLPLLPYPVATAFIELVLRAIEQAHARDRYFRTFGPANILISPQGTIAFLGLRGLQLSPTVFATPEIELGEAPSPGSDLYAVGQVLRSTLAAVDLPAPLRRLYAGRPGRREAHFWRQLVRIESKLASPDPRGRRLRVGRVRQVYRAFWSFVGVRPDDRALAEYALQARRTIESLVPAAIYDPAAATLRFADGRLLDLGSRPVQARLLAVLVEAHLDASCPGLDADTLIERVWPGERILQRAARNRLHVALSKLRGAGLGDVLLRDAEGRYALVEHLELACLRL